jgi:hypothetical protein
MKKSGVLVLIALLVLLVIVFVSCTGFFVVQPIGVMPEGITAWYWRAGLDIPFITSPDGYSQKTTGKVSLFSRGMALSAISENIKERIILRLPYSEYLYKISTDGIEYN